VAPSSTSQQDHLQGERDQTTVNALTGGGVAAA